MREYDVRKTQFTVTDFLGWQRDGSLNLNPSFQRRSVWKPDAKSYFMDTVAKGLPAPIIYLRQEVNVSAQKTFRAVVDGQQRLRTVFAYIDSSVLDDYNPAKDAFQVKALHNRELAGCSFKRLPQHIRERILSYEFSTHVLPINVEDREVLEMFARLNATGVKLNPQELRNAEFFGEFKSAMYALGLEQLNRWREWRIFTDDQISRMKEVEATSDLTLNMIKGLTGKTQKRLNAIYSEYEAEFPSKTEVQRRFRHTMDEIGSLLGGDITASVYSSEVYFFTLFVYIYDRLYGLGSSLRSRVPRKLRRGLRQRLLDVGRRFSSQRVPKNVLDAVQRASSDHGRRKTRLDYLRRQCHA